MEITRRPMSCRDCREKWLAEIAIQCPVEVFVALARALRCPRCGGKKLAFGWAHRERPAPDLTEKTDEERLSAWLKLHDNGVSSETLAYFMSRGAATCAAPSAYPGDSDDFGRCERLLCLYPMWRNRLGEMRNISPVWRNLVDRWPEIAERFWDEDAMITLGAVDFPRLCTEMVRRAASDAATEGSDEPAGA